MLVGGASDVDSNGDASLPSAEPERGFPCGEPGCAYSATTASSLKRHTRTHGGERPHACDEPGCEYRATRADILKAHKRTLDSSTPLPTSHWALWIPADILIFIYRECNSRQISRASTLLLTLLLKLLAVIDDH
jgi:hypothetical protein